MLEQTQNRQIITPKSARRLFIFLIGIAVCFVVIYWLDYFSGYFINTIHERFDFDEEKTVPTWFSSTQLFCIALAFYFLVPLRGGGLSNFSPLFKLLGVIFTFLSMDEVATIHETITGVLKKFTFIPRFKGNHGIWIPIYLCIGLVIFVLSYRQILKMYKSYPRPSLMITIGMVLYLAGVVGFEILGYEFCGNNQTGILPHLQISTEEFLEMAGASTVLYGALLFYCEDKN